MVVIEVSEDEEERYRVRLALWSFGDPKKSTILGTGAIINDGTGTYSTGNYEYRFFGKGGAKLKRGTGRITGHDRLKPHPWRLVQAVLDDIYKGTEDG
jgi:hypothetical protein